MDLPRLKIGLNDYLPVYLADVDRYTSVLLLGKAGGGKSSLLSSWWEQDYYFPVSKVMLDPSGFLARDCYSISKGKALYCSLDYPVGLNPMKVPYDPNTVSDLVAECVNQVVRITSPANMELTVKMRKILDRAVKYCLTHNRHSLENVRDEIAKMNDKGIAETRDGVLSRLDFLLSDERLRKIICANDSIEWGRFIQEGKGLIIDMFGLSREKFVFLGNIVSQGIKSYFRFERPKDYKPLAVYMDECHNFVNYNVLDLLKEGRKFKISAVLATQDLATVDPTLSRVMLNVGTIIAFRLGYREATLVAQEMNMDANSILFLDKYHVAYKTPREVGIAKTPRPPMFSKCEPKKEVVEVRQGRWFKLKPLSI